MGARGAGYHFSIMNINPATTAVCQGRLDHNNSDNCKRPWSRLSKVKVMTLASKHTSCKYFVND